jgi:hypothetical protein
LFFVRRLLGDLFRWTDAWGYLQIGAVEGRECGSDSQLTVFRPGGVRKADRFVRLLCSSMEAHRLLGLRPGQLMFIKSKLCRFFKIDKQPGNDLCVVQEDATEHIADVLKRVKPEYLVSLGFRVQTLSASSRGVW